MLKRTRIFALLMAIAIIFSLIPAGNASAAVHSGECKEDNHTYADAKTSAFASTGTDSCTDTKTHTDSLT